MISITINGEPLEVPAGTTVLNAARQAGFEIPTLCDHPALEPYGGCRLCMVEVEGLRTLQASCTLPVFNGMVIQTDTPKIHQARNFILTMLFSERNHFCMYCQKTDGDCELQNAAYGEGMTHWPYQPNWNNFVVDATHNNIVIDHNRCILCRRCVRACANLVGNHTLDIENRGARSLLVADCGASLGDSTCINCGTCVQICPTGALIDRQGVYIGKESSAEHIESVCQGCSVGCGIDQVIQGNLLVRVNGNWDAPVNQGVLCELGRYLTLEDARQRIETPLVRVNGKLEPATWEQALQHIAAEMKPLLNQNGSGIAALASTRLPAEALYALKDLFENQIASGMVTSIEEDLTRGLPLSATATPSLDALGSADCVLVLGADLFKSHQVAGFIVRRNLPKGAHLIVVDPSPNGMDAFAQQVVRIKPGSDRALLYGILAGLDARGMLPADISADLPITLDAAVQASGIPVETITALGTLLVSARQPVIVVGKGFTRAGSPDTQAALDVFLRAFEGASLVNVMGKANSYTAQALSMDKPFEITRYHCVYIALGDDYPTPRLENYLSDAHFLVLQASYKSKLVELADVVLPVETWMEQEGHFINLEGRLQKANRAVKPVVGVWSNLKVLQTLGKYMGFQTRMGWKKSLQEYLIQVPA